MPDSRRHGFLCPDRRRALLRKSACTLALTWLSLSGAGGSVATAQQIPIPRIGLLPAMPSPYIMRNWRAVTLGYDSLVFDFGRSGEYLPLGGIVSSTVNYPGHSSFVLHTYVGTDAPQNGEAINTLPAVIGARLAGVEKRAQMGRDWVLMCEEWFNRRPAENVYLNGPVASSGDDWWYETMPNVFFLQLASLYPTAGDFSAQIVTLADRWLAATRAMGGSATPWQVPSMNHRAWNLATMTANDNGVREPEAAGAIAWILYQAYRQTGEERYRVGAEWAMESLNAYPLNPSYELQLAYGAGIAARMNAELGTSYDVEKMVNWCFDVGPLRSWGMITGTWGGVDCGGLIGEVNGVNDYAFAMNTFEQIGALVPLVRYDDRFANAIGKWALHAANASRLFYPAFLPANQQDNAAWSLAHDEASVIAYEALRQSKGALSPYGTGDAQSGGWASTNLALYGSSHVGILGAIVDTTNVPGILRLDVLKTDYRHAPAFPTFLYYNPMATAQSVQIDAGPGAHDLYDAVGNVVLATNISGVGSFPAAPSSAVLLVVLPAGAQATFDGERMLVEGRVADFRSGQGGTQHRPRIKAVAADTTVAAVRAPVHVYCTAADAEDDALSYHWTASAGTVSNDSAAIVWTAPDSAGTCTLTVRIEDGHGGADTMTLSLDVVERLNRPPEIRRLTARPRWVELSGTSTLTCDADDPDGDPISFAWSSAAGALSGDGASVLWNAPATAGAFRVTCVVTDGLGGEKRDSISLLVADPSAAREGQLVAFYPFTGNASDQSGNGHDGVVSGAAKAADRFGAPDRAYAFDGGSAMIRIPNASTLNFTGGITVDLWMTPGPFFDREQYPISHGNWQSRWKVSISNGRLRWTIRTARGIKDLDTESSLTPDSLVNVAVTYDGTVMAVFLNGDLDAFAPFADSLLLSPVDLTIGQALPTDVQYGFRGVLDEVRIYNYALGGTEIRALADRPAGVLADGVGLPESATLLPNYPNPFNGSTIIGFRVPPTAKAGSMVTLEVFDLLGRSVRTLVAGALSPGLHEVVFSADGLPSGVLLCRLRCAAGTFIHPMLHVK